MRENQLKNIPILKERRRELRRNLTKAEVLLWSVLRNSKFKGKKFRRQHSFGGYIADFYCPSERLIIELDGDIHDCLEQEQYDKARDKYLNDLGYSVLRFKNKMILEELKEVLIIIERKLTTP